MNISSETVPGFFFPERPFLPDYVPVDESHPVRPQDPYALSKYFGELLMDAAVRRSDLRCISIRPCWVQHEGNYERNLGPQVRDASSLSPNFWSYVDVYDLADAIVLAVESPLAGHEVFYIASPDNVGGRPFAEMVRKYYGDRVEIRPLAREDASGISCAKAERMLGFAPKRSWRDYLDDQGRLKREIPETVERTTSPPWPTSSSPTGPQSPAGIRTSPPFSRAWASAPDSWDSPSWGWGRGLSGRCRRRAGSSRAWGAAGSLASPCSGSASDCPCPCSPLRR